VFKKNFRSGNTFIEGRKQLLIDGRGRKRGRKNKELTWRSSVLTEGAVLRKEDKKKGGPKLLW